MSKVTHTFTGRLVGGSLYDPNTTDMDGKPLEYKSGADKGKPRQDFTFRLAIAKTDAQHWAYTEWGAKLWALGNATHPNIAAMPGYSWKITDGDDKTPNPKSKPPGKRPCDYEGYPGHWILKFSGSFAPKIYRQENGGFVQVIDANFVKPGNLIDVQADAEGNGASQSPGLYLNHRLICFRGYSPLGEINFGPTPDQAGFGTNALPAGASMSPPPSNLPPPGGPATPPAGGAPPPLPPGGSAPPQSPPAPGAPAGAAPPSSIPVVPAPQFMNIPPAGSAAAPPPGAAAPVPPAGPRMTPTATTTYPEYIKAGWTDALLVQHGLMLA